MPDNNVLSSPNTRNITYVHTQIELTHVHTHRTAQRIDVYGSSTDGDPGGDSGGNTVARA